MKERIKAKVPEKLQQKDNTAAFLAEMNKPSEMRPPKPAKKFTLIQRNSAGFKSVQVVVSKASKTQDDITPEEYEVTTISLGKTTKIQEVHEFDDSYNTMKGRLNKEVEKRKKLEA